MHPLDCATFVALVAHSYVCATICGTYTLCNTLFFMDTSIDLLLCNLYCTTLVPAFGALGVRSFCTPFKGAYTSWVDVELYDI